MKKLILMISMISITGSAMASGYKVNSKARDFTLKNVDGKMVSMKDYTDAKGFIVIFTCNHCPFSVAYEDRINALDDKYSKAGYPVIAINPNDVVKQPDDSYEKMIVRAQEKSFTFPYLHDESQEIAKTYGATRTPHVYILEKEKDQLKVKYIGAIDNNSQDASKVTERFVEDAVDALLAGEQVKLKETKAIGCTIKWKGDVKK